MAKTYTSTIQLRCWKEHACAGCGAVYAYELIRKVKGTGRTAEKAQASAQGNVRKTLERDTDLVACPTCGLLQPDMIGQRRARKNRIVFWIALAAFGIILGLRGGHVLQSDLATWVAVGACGLTVLVILLIDVSNPNRDVQSNRRRVQERVAAGGIRLTPGQATVSVHESARIARTPIHLAALLMALAAVAAAAAPEVLRNQRHWPFNQECYPPVVGPGDSTRVYMNQKITSIKGYWRGKATATLLELNGSPVHAIRINATTNENDWGSHISVKSSEKDNSTSPWVNFSLPDDPALAGKTVKCDIHLDLEFPEMSGASTFHSISAQMGRALTIRLAPAHSGESYNTLWWKATGIGMGVILFSTLLLVGQARRLQRQAKPTRTYV